jgi:hypothetical protein
MAGEIKDALSDRSLEADDSFSHFNHHQCKVPLLPPSAFSTQSNRGPQYIAKSDRGEDETARCNGHNVKLTLNHVRHIGSKNCTKKNRK